MKYQFIKLFIFKFTRRCTILPFSTNTTGAAPDFMLNRNDGKSYYAIAQNDERGIINFIIYEDGNPTNPSNIQQMSDESFIESLAEILDSRFKGVILHLFEFQPTHFRSNYEFCCEIRKRLAALKIPYFFIARTEKNSSSAFIGANIDSKIGDIVLSVLVGTKNFIVVEYEFTSNGYKPVNVRSFPYIPESEESTKAKIMGNGIYSVIVGFSPFNHVSTSKLASIMKDEKKFVMVDLKKHGYKYPGETVKWMLDKSYTKFYIQPIAWKNTGIGGIIGKEMFKILYIYCDRQLPFKESVTVSKVFSHYLVHSITVSTKKEDLLCKRALPKNCHKYDITVAMDINQFLTVKANEIIIPEIEELPKKLNEICNETKIPVIGFFENSSVICVYKDGAEYKFLEQWGGLYGNENFINFGTDPATFGSSAITPFKTAMNAVVFDLIKIMSMAVNNIKKDSKWCFKITKDSDHPLLIEFLKHDGTLGAQTPAFLMAMILKEQLRKIKEEIGKKPKEIGFCFFDKFNAVERRRLEGKLQETCEHLKISCKFLNV